MKFVDTHCHLEQSEFEEDLQSTIQRAAEMDIHMITSGISEASWDRVLKIARKYDSVSASIGLDPTDYNEYTKALEMIGLHKDEIVAVGEVGLDHYRVRDHKERELQQNAFRQFIRLSSEIGLPIQIHSRSAGKVALEVLYETDVELVHMHAFDGRASYARTASNDYGYYFSIPTSIARSRQKQKLVKAVNIERLLVETDSPVLGPERGARNEPANLVVAVKEISKILSREYEEIREILLENTLRLYRNIPRK